jgi:cytidylate kinase
MDASSSTRPHMVVAVDGPSGSGKSSISKKSAEQLGLSFLDTGAMYRALTWFCLKNKLVDEVQIQPKLIKEYFDLWISIDPIIEKVVVNNEDITREIREDIVTTNVSKYAAMSKVREFLVKKQRELVELAGQRIVVEGRDIGSVVLPDADFKIYITASDEARAKRRAVQTNSDEKLVLEAQKIRDSLDKNRSVSPLVIPEDAVVLDNSSLDFDQSVDRFIQIVSA